MNVLQDFLPVLNYVLLIGLLIGGFFAFKKGRSQEASKIQGDVINALQAEVETLRRKVDDLEKERATQDRVIATIRYALKDRGLRVTIAGDFVTLRDSTGKSKTTHIQPPAPVQTLAPSPDDEDENGA